MAAENPKFYKGDALQLEYVAAKDGHTWKAGQFFRYTDSGVVPVKAAGTNLNGIFAKDQDTSTSSSSVYVQKIPSNNTKFIMAMRASSAGADTRAASSLIGKLLLPSVVSNVCGISKLGETGGYIKVEALYSSKEGLRNDTNDVPGLVVASITSAALQAEGTGV